MQAPNLDHCNFANSRTCYAFPMISGRQAYLHAQEEDRRGCYHKVCTPCSLLARRQVLAPPCYHQEAIRYPPHSASSKAHVKRSIQLIRFKTLDQLCFLRSPSHCFPLLDPSHIPVSAAPISTWPTVLTSGQSPLSKRQNDETLIAQHRSHFCNPQRRFRCVIGTVRSFCSLAA